MKKNILICDDDPDIVELITLLFEKEGHNVKVVNVCEDVWKTFDEQRPDLILMDLWVPEMGGETATKKLKTDKETKDIKVILLSASTDIAEAAERSGANGYLSKPFNIKELKNLI